MSSHPKKFGAIYRGSDHRKFEAVYVGSDHAGFALKNSLLETLKREFKDLQFHDLGCYTEEPVDYPDIAKAVGEAVAAAAGGRAGILVCGSGIGQSIAANKIKGVRAAVVWDVTSAGLSRRHNDANVVCLGSRLLGTDVALDICRAWILTGFEGGRHKTRIDLIRKLEGL